MVSKSEMKRINVQRGGTSGMTEQTKVLELAEKHRVIINVLPNGKVISVEFPIDGFLSFVAELGNSAAQTEGKEDAE